ncbi:hypothetical protein PV797_19095 [Clostridiaceae bacterium M8S5]|nr:hypothetical protein PV797_19095 [Clostridiaceae bacterium M8S5]
MKRILGLLLILSLMLSFAGIAYAEGFEITEEHKHNFKVVKDYNYWKYTGNEKKEYIPGTGYKVYREYEEWNYIKSVCSCGASEVVKSPTGNTKWKCVETIYE